LTTSRLLCGPISFFTSFRRSCLSFCVELF
jgi:hypothetical protein